MVLGNITVIVVCNSQVKQNIYQKRHTQQGSVHAKGINACNYLNMSIDSEDPQRFDQQVQEDDQYQVSNKLLLQAFAV